MYKASEIFGIFRGLLSLEMLHNVAIDTSPGSVDKVVLVAGSVKCDLTKLGVLQSGRLKEAQPSFGSHWNVPMPGEIITSASGKKNTAPGFGA